MASADQDTSTISDNVLLQKPESFYTNILKFKQYFVVPDVFWFILLRHETLSEGLHKALNFVVSTLESNEQHQSVSESWTFYIVHGTILCGDFYCLIHHQSSLSEYFCGIQRVFFPWNWSSLGLTIEGDVYKRKNDDSWTKITDKDDQQKKRHDLIKTLVSEKLSYRLVLQSWFLIYYFRILRPWLKKKYYDYIQEQNYYSMLPKEVLPTTTKLEMDYTKTTTVKSFLKLKENISLSAALLQKLNSLFNKLKNVLLKKNNIFGILLPTFFTLENIIDFVLKLLYLANSSSWPYFSLKYCLASVIPIYKPPQQIGHRKFTNFSTQNIIKTLFTVLLYAIRIFEWWIQNESLFNDSIDVAEKERLKHIIKNLPPPAGSIKNLSESPFLFLPQNPSLCPLCRLERKDPAASVGGYVFCYTCLENWLQRQYSCCPITRLCMKSHQIRRLQA